MTIGEVRKKAEDLKKEFARRIVRMIFMEILALAMLVTSINIYEGHVLEAVWIILSIASSVLGMVCLYKMDKLYTDLDRFCRIIEEKNDKGGRI